MPVYRVDGGLVVAAISIPDGANGRDGRKPWAVRWAEISASDKDLLRPYLSRSGTFREFLKTVE